MSGWEAMQQGAPDPFFPAGRAALDVTGLDGPAELDGQAVDPATTRDVDGYPGLVYAVGGMTQEEADRANGFDLCTCGPTTVAAGFCECGADAELRPLEACPCGDPGDCSGCAS